MQLLGIDISKHQGNFDIKNAKEQGAKFVIIRAGYTGSLSRSLAIDNKYERNYKLCKELKMPVGVYWYSRATSYELGKEEAKFLYEKCLIDKQFEYPIYMDVEDTKYQTKAGKKAVTEAIKGFCEYLEDKGFYVGIYASDISGFKNMMNIDELKRYDKWVARYGSKPSYVTDYQMWQFSSSNGKIKGAGDSLDLDYCYVDYPSIIKKMGKNGFKKETNKPKQETLVEVAKKVIAGKFGNGLIRKAKLTLYLKTNKLPYTYKQVQNKVNELLKK